MRHFALDPATQDEDALRAQGFLMFKIENRISEPRSAQRNPRPSEARICAALAERCSTIENVGFINTRSLTLPTSLSEL